MKVKVITMNPNGERFSRFKASAEKYGIKYDIEKGVDTSNVIEGDNLSKRLEERLPGLTKGMLGCTLAHLQLIERCAEDNEPWVIFEDDARFLPNIDLESVEKEFLKSRFGILHLQTNDLRFFKEDAEGLLRINTFTSISTCAYFIKPEAARRILHFCKKTKEGRPIAPKVIDGFFRLANESNLQNGVQVPLMVCHSGIDTVVANSAYIIPPEEDKELTFSQHKTNAEIRLKLEIRDNLVHGMKVGGYKVIANNKLDLKYRNHLVSLREEESILESPEETEKFNNEEFIIEGAKDKEYVVKTQEYRKFLIQFGKRYRGIKANAQKRERAIENATTIPEIFKAIEIEL